MAAQTPIQQVAQTHAKDEFTEYVKELAQFQRSEIAKRVDKIANHQRNDSKYFWGCQGAALSCNCIAMYFWGPRNATVDKLFYIRPIGPVVLMGVCAWALLHQVRYYIMKVRLWSMTEDFDYQLKKVKAHHVKEGAIHLAWMQFVINQVRVDKAKYMNIAALEHEPMLQQPEDPAKVRF